MARAKSVLIRDKPLMAELVRLIIAQNGGTQAEAADRLGVDQATLSTLINKKKPTIHLDTFARLIPFIPAERQHERDRLFLTPSVDQVLTGYEAWLKDAGDQLLIGAGHLWEKSSKHGIRKRRISKAKRLQLRRTEWKSVLKYFQEQCDDDIKDFIDELNKYGHDRKRLELALIRIIAPLLESPDSAYIERSWEEMKDPERIQFFQAGIVREQLLLKRSPNFQRAQELDDPS